MQINTLTSFLRTCCICVGLLMMVPCTVLAAGDPCRDIGVAGDCELFKSNIQVQPMVAQELIRVALNDKNVQFGEYTNKFSGDDTYEVTDSKGAKHIFWFDDMQDSKSGTVDKSVATAICLLNGGELDDSYRCMGRVNGNIYEDLKQFAMTADCKCQNGCISETVQTPHCKIYVKSVFAGSSLNDFTHNGVQLIDPNAFSDMQIVSTGEVQEFLRDYVMLKLITHGLVLESFTCYNRPLSYGVDDILRCTVKYYDTDTNASDTKNIDFVFDDMFEYGEKASSAGRAGLVCNSQGGSATSKGMCAGFTQEMCTTVASKYNVATRWDESAGGCIMENAESYAKSQQALTVATAAAGLAVGIMTIPVTGGVAVVAMIGGIMTVIATGVSMSVADKIDAAFTAALLNANKTLVNQCGGVVIQSDGELRVRYYMDEQNANNTDYPECVPSATSAIQQLIKAVIAYNGEYTNSDAAAASYLIEVLSSVMDGTMQPVCIDAMTANIEQSSLVTTKRVADAAMLIGVVLSLGGGGVAKIKGANAESLLDNTIKGVKGLKNARANVAAVEQLANASRMQALGTRMQKTYKIITNAISDHKKIRGIETLSKSTPARKFLENVATFGDLTDGTNSSGSIYDAWTASGCTKDFPCNKTVADFMNAKTLNTMCTGGQI